MPSDPQATFIAHRQELLAWFTYRLRDTHLARDLVQELFIRFIEAAPAAGVQDARAYLFQIARNMLADRARQQAVRRTDNVAHEDLARIADDAPGPEQTMAQRERLAELAAVLGELPELTQQIFVRHRVWDRTYEQVAAELGISTSTVQKHLARALAHVMKRMKPN